MLRRIGARAMFAALSCIVLFTGAAAAGGPPVQLALRVASGARLGGLLSYTADVAKVPSDARTVVLYAGTPGRAAPLLDQTCVRASGSSWECAFTLAPNATDAARPTVYAVAFRGGDAFAASRAAPVGGSARTALPELWALLGLFAVGAVIATRSIVRKREASL